MGVFKKITDDGKITWYADWYDSATKRHRKSFRTKKEAQDFLASVKARKFREKVLGTKEYEEVYFYELVERFKDFSKAHKKPRTHETNLIRLKHLEPFFGNMFLSDISMLKVDEYKTIRLNEVSISTVNRELSVLKHMLNLAESWGMYQGDTTKKIKKMKEVEKKVEFLTKDEIKLLLRACKCDLETMYVELALNTGMREGEILGLEWSNVDLNNKLIHVVVQFSRGSYETPKSGKQRTIPINDRLYNVLSDYKEKHKNGKGKKNYVIENRYISERIHQLFKSAGLKGRSHTLRHTFASHCVMQGVDLTTLSKLLGHSTIQMTMRYAHLSPDHKSMAVKKISEFLDT